MSSNTELKTIRYPFYDDERIQRGVKFLASRINDDWNGYTEKRGGHPLYICLMDGAVQFFTDLTKLLEPGYVAYVKASSYGNSQTLKGAKSKHKVNIDLGHLEIPEGVNRILIIDDICDSGKTLMTVFDLISQMVTADVPVECCTLLNRKTDVYKPNPDYYAILVDNNYFFAGYGLDDKGLMRNAPFIYVCGWEDK